ncbi:MAG: hypothetical protein OXM60_20375 [Defluviicoccus sp.]|nr:hypothetical protein [Defluviicoccus sp.]
MCDHDIEARRARDLERYRRRTAERRAQGLCPTCGKRPPAPGRSRCEPCAAKKRPAELARHRRRVAARIAARMCPKCGKRPPAPERRLCAPCAAKTNRASRARDARLREAGVPRRDPEHARAYERERARRQAEARRAAGLCPACGKAPVAEGRSRCEPCAGKRRTRERARYARASSEGKLYGGRPVESRRRIGRERHRKRDEARRAAGLCTSCGKQAPVEGGATCTPCRQARQAAERKRYAARKAAGRCTRCAGPVFDGLTRCGPCGVLESERRDRERKNAWSRALYRRRRARSECTACGAPSQGAARCAPCAERSWHGSAWFKGMPAWDPSFTVVERATGETLGTYDSEAEAAAALVFAKLGFEQIEVVTDVNPVMRWAAWA